MENMFKRLFANLKADNSNVATQAKNTTGSAAHSSLTSSTPPSLESTPASPKRNYKRRSSDHCVCLIDGRIHPVKNWSMGGFIVQGDANRFTVGDTVDINLKFLVDGEVLDIEHKAEVIRKNVELVGFKFEPVPEDMRKKLQHVIDDEIASEFVNSQIA